MALRLLDILDCIEGFHFIDHKSVHNDYLKLNPFEAKKNDESLFL